MTVSVDEDQCACDRDIYYPNLQTCLSITCALTNSPLLLGTHLTTGTTNDDAKVILGQMREWQGGMEVAQIYLIGNLAVWANNVNTKLRWNNTLVATLRKSFKFKGPVYAFDSVTAPGGGIGSAAEIESMQNSQPACRYVGSGRFLVSAIDRSSEGMIKRLRRHQGQRTLEATIVPRSTMFSAAPTLIRINDFMVRR